jgi:transposase
MTTEKKQYPGTPAKNKRNKKVCEMRQKGYTYEEISDKFGITRGRVYQILRDNGLILPIGTDKPRRPEDGPEDLISFAECARIAGVANSTVTSWATRFADFPPRYGRLANQKTRATNVRRPEFEEWLKKHKERSRPQAGVARSEYNPQGRVKKVCPKRKSREMRIIIDPIHQPKTTFGGHIKRFLGINS